jgi:tetratricopeptide (TPR) repeat protein
MSLDTARRFRDVSANHGDAAATLVGERTIGMSLFYLGDHTSARRHAELLLDRYVRPMDRSHVIRFQFDPRIVARTLRSKLLWAQGCPDQALQEVQGLVEEAKTVGHPMSLALALAQGACPVTLLCGDWNAAERFINLLTKHSMEHALDLWHDWGVCFAAMLLIERGDIEKGLKALKEALDELPQDAFFARYAGIRATLAEALGRTGAISSGYATVDEAIMRSEQQGERWYIAEFLRVKGELLQLEETWDARAKAEEQFRRSLDCARQQEAPSWELRTALSLARLYQRQGQRIAARDALEPVYTRFKEGFETADLKRASALMSEVI